MIVLKALKVKGFRAYTKEREFVFDNPAIFLFGENHCGKSSTLNAIEWCLFGSDCVGKETGIRERVDWEIPNRNMRPPDVLVVMELEDKASSARIIVSRRWVSARRDELKLVLSNGQELAGQEAKEKIAQLFKLSFRDFLTMVYQHQEAIRAIITEEPKDRNDAIDRLLGLSDYRNILGGIKDAEVARKQRKMGDDFSSFEQQIDTALHTRESDLGDKRREAIGGGLKEDQLSEKGALEIANAVKAGLLRFASEADLKLTPFDVGRQWKDLYEFQRIANGEIEQFRSEMPDIKKQQQLFKERTNFIELRAKWKQLKGDFDKAHSDFKAKEEDTVRLLVEQKEVEKKIEEKQKKRSEVSAKGAVVSEALDYLRMEGVDKNICPVCGSERADLCDHLEEERSKRYASLIEAIESELKILKKRQDEMGVWFDDYEKVKRRFVSANSKVQETIAEIGKFLGKEIGPKDDPDVILNEAIQKSEEELEKLRQAVEEKQNRLNGIDSSLRKVQLILDILSLEEKKRMVEQIQETDEYKKIEKLRDLMATLVMDVENIKQAVGQGSQEAAQQKVEAASRLIDDYFRRITNHPSISNIKFSVSRDSRTGLNSYFFKDQNGQDVTPILSQGDLNAMALAIFLGMACADGTNQMCGFIMLDDPSQSLGSEHKGRLVGVLDEVVNKRMVILSSMDKELQNLVLSKISKAKTKYVFSEWSPKEGPNVKKE